MKRTPPPSLSILLALALAAGAASLPSGCGIHIDFGSDTSGTGGTGTSAAGGTAGTGAAGGAMCDPAMCPTPGNECKVAACIGGACAEEDAPDGQIAATQVAGDCKKNICQAGLVTPVPDDTDIEDDARPCTADSCIAGAPQHTPLLGGACADMGGAVCDSAGSGNCVECNGDADCAGHAGGKTACDPTKVCVVPDCMDGIEDGAETDIDCGGPSCAKCAVDQTCITGADCLTGVCVGQVCQLQLLGPLGASCVQDGACASGHCADGVCCDTACAGACQACSAAKKGGGPEGVCAPVADGSDPDDDCAANTPASCQLSGACQGGACVKYAAGTLCQAAQCSGPFTLSMASLCNGSGTCVPQADVSCAPYTCAGGACKAACVADSECTPGDYCAMSVCLPKKPLGMVCASSNECMSGSCADGVCCNTVCAGLCQACSAVKKGGGADGTCGEIALGADPDSECASQPVSTCGQTGACDGAGACQLYPAGAVCAAAQCTGPSTLSKPDVCDGMGVCLAAGTQDCTPYACSGGQCFAVCSNDAQCAAGYHCNASQCQPLIVDGPCASNAQCQSGFCVDGVCCNSACSGLCQACSAIRKGAGQDGICGLIAAGTDPDNECPGAQTCNGAGMCQ